MSLILPRNRLAFPGTKPGFSLSHVAANQIRYSGIAQGASFRNLLSGERATTVGSPVAKITSVGPAVDFSGSTARLTTTGIVEAMNFTTMAAIVSFTSTATSVGYFFVTGNRSSPNVGLVANSDQINYWNNGGFSAITSLSYAADTPYFFAVSSFKQASSAIVQVAVVVNLQTGAVYKSVVPGTRTNQSTTTAVYTIGGFSGFTSSAVLSAVMMSAAPLTIGQVDAWAQSPWDFWYPPATPWFSALRGVGGALAARPRVFVAT